MLKVLSFLKYAFHRPQAIEHYFRKDRIEQKKKEGWKVVKDNGELVLMRKG